MRELVIGLSIAGCALGLICGGCYAYPKYNVWQQGLSGQAELQKAEWNRQIKVQEAEAIRNSATFYGEADIIRAKAEAEANNIIGDSLKDNEARLRYLWIQNIENGNNRIIYVPTEANMPILEAGRIGIQSD